MLTDSFYLKLQDKTRGETTMALRCLLTAIALLQGCLFLIPPGALGAEASYTDSVYRHTTGILQPLIERVSGNPWVQGSLVILASFLVAALLTWLLFIILRAITRRTPVEIDDQIATILRIPIYYSLLVSGFRSGIDLMPLQPHLATIIGRAFQSVGLFVWVVFAVRLATILLKRVAEFSDRYPLIERRTVTLFDNIAKVIIFAAGIYGIFLIWNINMTAWLASAGIVGIAVGFAAKDTLSNLFAGVFILADAPYKVGDYIVLDRGDRGKVTNIGLRSTRILTRDDIEITIPNSIIGNTTIINQSGGPHEKMRVRLKVGVAYGSDVDQVKKILMQTALEEPTVCTEPEPRIRFRVFGTSSLDFELLFWVDNPEVRGRVVDSMNTKVYQKFNEHGIEIPYSKQDLYIKGLPGTLTVPTSGTQPDTSSRED
jgi:small-conductance mechanosensitive channel